MTRPPIRFPLLPIEGGGRLRPWTAADAPALVAALNGDETITRYLPMIPSPYTVKDAHQFAAACGLGLMQGILLSLAIEDAQGQAVGSIALDFCRTDVPSLGYWLSAQARGTGMATRAAIALCDYARRRRFERLALFVDAGNAASIAVALRAGFHPCGRSEVCEGGISRERYELALN